MLHVVIFQIEMNSCCWLYMILQTFVALKTYLYVETEQIHYNQSMISMESELTFYTESIIVKWIEMGISAAKSSQLMCGNISAIILWMVHNTRICLQGIFHSF